MKPTIANKLNGKELQRFLIVGFSAVGADGLVYFALINTLDTNLSKMISFVSGSVLAFLLNKFWTFENSAPVRVQILKFSILYISTLFVNNYTNSAFLNMFGNTVFAFLVATGVSTVLNFLGQKFWVFK